MYDKVLNQVHQAANAGRVYLSFHANEELAADDLTYIVAIMRHLSPDAAVSLAVVLKPLSSKTFPPSCVATAACLTSRLKSRARLTRFAPTPKSMPRWNIARSPRLLEPKLLFKREDMEPHPLLDLLEVPLVRFNGKDQIKNLRSGANDPHPIQLEEVVGQVSCGAFIAASFLQRLLRTYQCSLARLASSPPLAEEGLQLQSCQAVSAEPGSSLPPHPQRRPSPATLVAPSLDQFC